MGGDDATLARQRKRLAALLSPESFVDVAATIGAFSVSDRVANATGTALDEMMDAMSGDVQAELKLDRFASAASTVRQA